MSAQAECPLCGHVSRNVSVPDPRWGHALRQGDLDEATILETGWRSRSDQYDPGCQIHQNLLAASKTTFWCPCGRMVWMEGQGWLVSLDFVARLATSIRQALPDDYLRMMATLAVLMPEEIQRVRALLGADS